MQINVTREISRIRVKWCIYLLRMFEYSHEIGVMDMLMRQIKKKTPSREIGKYLTVKTRERNRHAGQLYMYIYSRFTMASVKLARNI